MALDTYEKFNKNSSVDNSTDAIVKAVSGSRFEDVVRTNPYANFSYQNGLWDKIGDALGFRTNQDKVRDQFALASAEYNAQAVQNMSEEEYNSESSQVARLRAAGLNPDLQGVNPSSATEFAQEQVTPDLSSNSNAETAQSIIMNMITLATGSLGLASQWQDYAGKKIANDTAEAGLDSALESRARSWILSEFGPDETPESLTKKGVNWFDTVIANAGTSLFQPGTSSRYRKRFQEVVRRVAADFKSFYDIYKGQGDFADVRRKYLTSRGSFYYTPANDEERYLDSSLKTPDEQMAWNLEPLVQYMDMALANNLSAESWRTQNENDYQRAYAEFGGPESAADAADAANQESAQSSKAKSDMNAPIRQFIHRTAKSAQKGDIASLLLLLKLYDMYSGNKLANEGKNIGSALGNLVK